MARFQNEWHGGNCGMIVRCLDCEEVLPLEKAKEHKCRAQVEHLLIGTETDITYRPSTPEGNKND